MLNYYYLTFWDGHFDTSTMKIGWEMANPEKNSEKKHWKNSKGPPLGLGQKIGEKA